MTGSWHVFATLLIVRGMSKVDYWTL